MLKYYALERAATDIENIKLNPNLIYIDPPFGLNRNFTMEEQDGVSKGFSDNWDSQEDFLIWYANIIEKCYNVLNKDGFLYCHNNFIMNALVLSKLKILSKLDTNISWRRSHPHNNIKNSWGNIVDSILVFKKGSPVFNVQYSELDETYKNNSFGNSDEHGNYALTPITGEKSRLGHMYEFNGFNPKFGWRKSLEEVKKLDEQNLIHYGKNKPYKKMYLKDSKGPPIQNFWNDIHPVTRTEKQKREYPTQKPVGLLERIIESSSQPGDLVFDPFCGSGTTLLSSYNLGRSCITSDLNLDALEIAVDRLNEKGGKVNTDVENVWEDKNRKHMDNKDNSWNKFF
jgi:DNA modification methylase